MESTFNPYLKWLGIPLKHQPPTHYRLLGVELFEADADIIERAADRQMTYLRSLQTGEHSAAAQQLLNEISTAKVCLLDEQRKAEYDERLQLKTQELGLRPKAPPAIGENGHSASASGVLTAAPPPRRTAKAPELRTAQPLAAAAPTKPSGPLPMIALNVASDSRTATKATPATKATSAVPEAEGDAAKKKMLPLVLGAAAAGAFLLLSLGVAAIAFWPSSDTDDVAQVETDLTQGTNLNLGGDDTTDDEITRNNTGLNPSNQFPRVVTDNPSGEDPIDVETPAEEVVGTRPQSAKGASVEIDGQFLLGTLDDGEDALSDRGFKFKNVDAELQGLEVTRWPFGEIKSFKIKPLRKGLLYLILPPEQYAQAAPTINLQGWEETALTCDVEVDGGVVLPCRVYRRSEPLRKEMPVATTSTAWPLVAAGKIGKPTRILGDIVASTDPPPREKPIKVPNPNRPPVRPPVEDEPEEDEPEEQPEKVAAKIKVPANDVQKPVRDRLNELYKIDSLKSIDEKISAAKNLLDVGREPSDKPEERYVMLATAAQLAADGGDLLTALLAVETIDIDYDGDASAMKLHLARLFAKSNATPNVKAQQLAEVLPIIDEGLANDHFDAIDELIKELMGARIGKSPELAARRKIALDMKETYRKVTTARKTLETNPDDATANRVVGEYLCYYKLDWDQGLPHLAKADDDAIKSAAAGDTANPEAGADQLKVADRWFDVAKELDAKTDERQKGSLLARAQEWYEKAAPEVRGLDEAHAKKRLDEVKAELVKLGWVDVPRKAVIVATCGYGFDCYLNGERLFSGSYDVESHETILKRGDLLLFRATKSTSSYSSYNKGFACVIAFEGAQTVATGLSKGWEGFVPSDEYNWYRAESAQGTTPIIASNGIGHQDLYVQTGVGARSVWYAAGNTGEAYFFYRVR